MCPPPPPPPPRPSQQACTTNYQVSYILQRINFSHVPHESMLAQTRQLMPVTPLHPSVQRELLDLEAAELPGMCTGSSAREKSNFRSRFASACLIPMAGTADTHAKYAVDILRMMRRFRTAHDGHALSLEVSAGC